MGLPFCIRGGKVRGREHTRAGKNCQDGYELERANVLGKEYLIGAISDGCGEGGGSEIAALMLPKFVVAQVQHLLLFETPISQIPVSLYPAVIGFLESIRKQFPFANSQKIIEFISENLLATVLGFVIGETEGVAFHAGDGFVVVNEQTIKIEHGNESPYIGYHLVPHSALKKEASELPRTFSVITLPTEKLQRLVIASDGFSGQLMERMFQEANPAPLGIQLWLNLINGPRNPEPEKGLFYDDGAVIWAERNEEENA